MRTLSKVYLSRAASLGVFVDHMRRLSGSTTTSLTLVRRAQRSSRGYTSTQSSSFGPMEDFIIRYFCLQRKLPEQPEMRMRRTVMKSGRRNQGIHVYISGQRTDGSKQMGKRETPSSRQLILPRMIGINISRATARGNKTARVLPRQQVTTHVSHDGSGERRANNILCADVYGTSTGRKG